MCASLVSGHAGSRQTASGQHGPVYASITDSISHAYTANLGVVLVCAAQRSYTDGPGTNISLYRELLCLVNLRQQCTYLGRYMFAPMPHQGLDVRSNSMRVNCDSRACGFVLCCWWQHRQNNLTLLACWHSNKLQGFFNIQLVRVLTLHCYLL